MKPPYNAEPIIDLRKKGKKPVDMILVSMVGWLGELNPCVLARPGKSYDWSFLHGLSALLVVDSQIPKEQVKAVIDAVLQHHPAYLGVWLSDKAAGFHVAWGSYRPKLPSIRNMSFLDKRNYFGIGAKKHEL